MDSRGRIYWALTEGVPECLNEQIKEAYSAIVGYVTKFLLAKHPFRDGDVCPFARRAVEEDTIRFTFIPFGSEEEECLSILREAVISHENWKKSHNGFGAIVVFLIEMKSERWIKSIHRKLAGEVMKKGLILGNLHPDSPSHSFHSRTWYPLRSPYPMFLIRDMVTSDRKHLEESKVRYGFIDRMITGWKWVSSFWES